MTLFCENGQLETKQPFDFDKSLKFLSHFPAVKGEQQIILSSDIARGSCTKAISVQNRAVVFELTAAENNQPLLNYTLYSDKPLTAEITNAVTQRIAFFLSLDDDLAPFYQIGNSDSYFAPIIQKLYGLHHVKFLTVTEAACWAILTQHQPMAIASQFKRKLVENYGNYLEVKGVTYSAFPERANLATVSQADLAELIKNERKAEYLHNLLQALGEIDEDWLRTAPYDEAEQRLRKIKGVGEWSAAFILLRALGRMERLLLDMKPFLKILPQLYGPTTTMKELAAYYGDWFGYWGYYTRAAN